MSAPTPLNAFLARSHGGLLQQLSGGPPRAVHLVFGNEAADPDSCVCAITMAAALDVALEGQDALVAPVIPISRADFKLQLDRVHLLKRAGLDGSGDGPNWTPTHVCFADEVLHHYVAAAEEECTPSQPQELHVHLVDHNKLASSLSALGPRVASIVDHHAEEGLYTESVPAESRLVELGIGSCASLVAERLRSMAPSLLQDASVCSLLLGAILLDTVNLDPTAKAQKEREASIAEGLLQTAAPHLGLRPGPGEHGVGGRAQFFQELFDVKNDRQLLLGFPTPDLLRQDYKQEAMGQGGALHVGVGSTVVPLPLLLERQPFSELQADCAAFSASRGLQALMLMAVDSSIRQRYLLFYCGDDALRERVLQALSDGGAMLAPLGGGATADAAAVLQTFTINDYKVSRKLLLPMLRSAL